MIGLGIGVGRAARRPLPVENLLSWSNGFDNAAWAKDSLIQLLPSQDSPTIAGNEGWLVTDNDNSYQGIRQVVNISHPENIASFRIKKTSEDPTYFPLFDFLYLTADVANTDTYWLFNTNNGAFNQVSIGTPCLNPFFRVVSINDEWWLVEFGGTDGTGTQTRCQAGIYPAGSLNGTSLSPNAVGSQIIYGAQLRRAGTSDIYVPTTNTPIVATL